MFQMIGQYRPSISSDLPALSDLFLQNNDLCLANLYSSVEPGRPALFERLTGV